MSTGKNTALAKTHSLKITMFNAITELEVQAEAARLAENHSLSGDLSRKANELAEKAILIRRAEDEIRLRNSLRDEIDQLDRIASDSRKMLKRLKKISEALDASARLIQLITQIAGIFS